MTYTPVGDIRDQLRARIGPDGCDDGYEIDGTRFHALIESIPDHNGDCGCARWWSRYQLQVVAAGPLPPFRWMGGAQ